jgi:predicted Zn-dependent protease
MKIRILSLFVVSAVLVVGCQNVDMNRLGSMVKNVSTLIGNNEEKEVEVGTGMAARLVDVAPLVDDADLQMKVNRVGTWLTLQLDDDTDSFKWRFGVIDTNDINAFATPAGYILITRGLIEKLNDDHELAGVIAHEMNHVVQHHYVKGIKLAAGISLVGDVASMSTDEQEYRERIDKATSAGTELWSRGLDKNLEFECDRNAVVLAARSGYDPYGLVAVLQTLEAMDPGDNALAMLYKSHPKPSERLEQLTMAMASSDL